MDNQDKTCPICGRAVEDIDTAVLARVRKRWLWMLWGFGAAAFLVLLIGMVFSLPYLNNASLGIAGTSGVWASFCRPLKRE